jgi:hypothetical protein
MGALSAGARRTSKVVAMNAQHRPPPCIVENLDTGRIYILPPDLLAEIDRRVITDETENEHDG